MRIAVFDIGTRNFAMIVEEISNRGIKNLCKSYELLSEKEKIKQGKMHCEKLVAMLQEYYTTGKTILLKLFDPNKGESGLTNNTRLNLFEFLETHKKVLKTCSYLVLEEQYYDPSIGVINKPALLLGESCYAWLLLNIHEKVSYTQSKLKTALLSCPKEAMMVDKKTGLRMLKKWTKTDRKKWSQVLAKEIYGLRGDSRMIKYIEERKGDDVSDCLLMSIAFILNEFVM